MTPKSCLKAYQSPPRTPDLSTSPSPSPSVSGRTSPSESACSAHGGCCRGRLVKTVSFCAEEALEEVFFVDDWDRSPAPVTPKLSYQDVLELKQLQLSLPRAPTPSTYRQPFTTSSPSAYTHTHTESCASSAPSSPSSSTSSGSGAFPLSRFAAQPSQTPSRWKNRRQNPGDIDPDILPYLEAVPIRLLPLLDSSSSAEAENSSAAPSPSALSTSVSGGLNSNPSSAFSISPLPPASSLLSHTPLASTNTPPSSLPSSRPAMPARTPSITLRSPSGTASVPILPSPPPTPTLSPTPAPGTAPARRPNFAFVPLLPVQDAPAPAPAPPVEKREERPRRRISMTFVPLMGAEPPSPSPSPGPGPNPNASHSSDFSANLDVGRSVSPLEQRTPTLGPVEPPEEDLDFEEESDADQDQDQEREHGTSTPSLSSASDTDTDVETDREGDNDNVNGADARVHAEYEQHQYECEQDAGETDATFDAYGYTYADTTYFSPRVSSTAGLTPPLGALYPGLGLGGGLAGEMPKRRLLAALPSPALVPPSPFSLYPPGVSPGAGWGAVVGGSSPFVPPAGLPSVAEGAEGAGEAQAVSTTTTATRTTQVVVVGGSEQALGAGQGVTLMASSSSLVVEARSSPFVPIEEPGCQDSEAAADAACPAANSEAGAKAGLGVGIVSENESGVDGVADHLGDGAVGLERSAEEGVLRPSLARRERARGPACERLVEA